jgi:predicted nuclease of predicted toxin-antitoxin system
MRFLADMCVSMATVRALLEAGHDAVHLRDEGLQRLADDEVLAKARREGRVVLTFDLDFGDLLALGLDDSPSVVVFRLGDATPASVNRRLLAVIDESAVALDHGAVVVVEDHRYRLRSLPIRA